MDTPATGLELGVLRHLRGDLAGAEELYRAALEPEPENPVTLNNLGLAIAQPGRIAEAVTWYERALALDADRAIAHLNLGNAHTALGVSVLLGSAVSSKVSVCSRRGGARVRG